MARSNSRRCRRTGLTAGIRGLCQARRTVAGQPKNRNNRPLRPVYRPASDGIPDGSPKMVLRCIECRQEEPGKMVGAWCGGGRT